jgi:glycerol-3-phosphate acyltransferase PlsX
MEQSGKTLKIAVDAMGGDYAPGEVIKGVVAAAKEPGVEIILVGPSAILHTELAKYDASQLPIRCVNADEFVKEGEPPALVLRQKRNASVIAATKLVKSGDADAVVSAGPTGAVVASALTILGNAEGMERPVVGGPMLGFSPNTVIMDFGGNVDCKPYHLLNFAIVGCVYAQKLLNIPNPTVALLSVGSEEGKGNELVKESWPLFKKSGLNFIGNVEGNDIVAGKANVVVCDGFVGNTLLKFLEGLGVAMDKWLETNLNGKLSDIEIDKLRYDLLARTVGADIMGGAPLLGVNGVAMVMHGRSQALQFTRAIGQAKVVVESGLVDTVNSELLRIKRKLDDGKN